MTTLYDYIIYTDGAYSLKNDEGAFAYVMLDGQYNHVKKLAKKIVHETNNRAELKAIIAAIYHLPDGARNIKVVSDSQYALKTLSGEWSHGVNEDLFEVYDRIISNHDYNIDYEWVKGHSGNKYNELCDQLCNSVLGYDANAETEKYRKK